MSEPSITDRFMANIEMVVNSDRPAGIDLVRVGYTESKLVTGKTLVVDGLHKEASSKPYISWHAKTLRSARGKGAEEKEFGADVLGVLTINDRQYSVAKGFLCQAKRAEPDKSFSKREWNRLREQCDAMLAVSPDSFVLCYSLISGMRFFSANAVRSYSGCQLFDLYDMSVKAFFERHLASFIGDSRLHSPHITTLTDLQRQMATEDHSGHVLDLDVDVFRSE